MNFKHFFAFGVVLLLCLTDSYSQLPPGRNPGNNWKDSYKADNLCWCDSSFDHGLTDVNKVSFVINGKKRNIKNICDELKKHPKYRKFRKGDPVYNDIQCGNGPANTAIDETQCPGRVDKGRNGCSEKGPRWDVQWLASRSRFGGGGGNPAPTTPTTPTTGNRTVSILAKSSGKYVSSEDGRKSIVANRDRIGEWERFTMISKGGNVYGFKANNNQFISSEDGRSPMNANRSTMNSWERFTLVSRGGNVYALKGNNGKYVNHKGGNAAMTCTSTTIGNNEEFIIRNVAGQKIQGAQLETTASNIYPNPYKLEGKLNLQVGLSEQSNAVVQVFDISGKNVYQRDLGVLEAGMNIITLEGIQRNVKNSGMYIVQIQAGAFKKTMKLHVIQ